jgi:hypothetical protein
LFVLFCFCFWDRVSLCIPGCSLTWGSSAFPLPQVLGLRLWPHCSSVFICIFAETIFTWKKYWQTMIIQTGIWQTFFKNKVHLSFPEKQGTIFVANHNVLRLQVGISLANVMTLTVTPYLKPFPMRSVVILMSTIF